MDDVHSHLTIVSLSPQRTVAASHEAVAAAAAAAAAGVVSDLPMVPESVPAPLPPAAPVNVDFERMVAGSELVFLKDKDLVPDALFVAIAQSAYKFLTRLCEFSDSFCKYSPFIVCESICVVSETLQIDAS